MDHNTETSVMDAVIVKRSSGRPKWCSEKERIEKHEEHSRTHYQTNADKRKEEVRLYYNENRDAISDRKRLHYLKKTKQTLNLVNVIFNTLVLSQIILFYIDCYTYIYTEGHNKNIRSL